MSRAVAIIEQGRLGEDEMIGGRPNVICVDQDPSVSYCLGKDSQMVCRKLRASAVV